MALPKFTEFNDLTCEDIGGKILFATDDWFASAENLLKSDPAVWKEGFTDFGKWMDGWETRRKRKPGHDWCIIKLGLTGKIVGFEVDTAFFTGNYTPKFSIQGKLCSSKSEIEDQLPPRDPSMGKEASIKDLEQASKINSDSWETLVPMTPLRPGYPETRHNYFEVKCDLQFSHLRLNMFPDGGIARFRTYGIVSRPDDPSKLKCYSVDDFKDVSNFPFSEYNFPNGPLVDLLAMENGSVCQGFSDAHYGHPRNMARPGRGKNMGDGWETARRLDRPAILTASPINPDILEFVGFEFAVFNLGVSGHIHLIEVDTNHFKGNFPDSIEIFGATLQDDADGSTLIAETETTWSTKILPAQKLGPHKRHFFFHEILHHTNVTHVKVTIKPDGGISRIRLLGNVA